MMVPVHEPVEEEILQSLSVLSLAHVGDAVYELLVRTYLARQGGQKIADQHKRTIAYVSAPAQAAAMERLLPVLTAEEHALYRRGRNARVHGCPAGCTIAQYHSATALEALFGHLWLKGKTERIEELFGLILEEDDGT